MDSTSDREYLSDLHQEQGYPLLHDGFVPRPTSPTATARNRVEDQLGYSSANLNSGNPGEASEERLPFNLGGDSGEEIEDDDESLSQSEDDSADSQSNTYSESGSASESELSDSESEAEDGTEGEAAENEINEAGTVRAASPDASNLSKKAKKQAGPSKEYRRLQGLALNAFLSNQLEDALKWTCRAIEENPEVFLAHNLLAEVTLAMGKTEQSIGALLNGAYTKRDPELWRYAAKQTLKLQPGGKVSALRLAYVCYSQIILISRDDYEARYERLKIHVSRDHTGKAKRDAFKILEHHPDDLPTLELLAQICTSNEDAETILELFNAFFDRQGTAEATSRIQIGWEHTKSYIDLFIQLGRYEEGIRKLNELIKLVRGRNDKTRVGSVPNVSNDTDHGVNKPSSAKKAGAEIPPHEGRNNPIPLDYRLRLGILELGAYRTTKTKKVLQDALDHLLCIDKVDGEVSTFASQNKDLFRAVGEALQGAKQYELAVKCYRVLAQQKALDGEGYASMATCLQETGHVKDAVEVLKLASFRFPYDISCRMKLVKLYEAAGLRQEAIDLAHSVTRMRLKTRNKRPLLLRIDGGQREDGQEHLLGHRRSNRHWKRKGLLRLKGTTDREDLLERAQVRHIAMRGMYEQLVLTQQAMDDEEDEKAVELWMRTAEELIEDFYSMECFYPSRERIKFAGYGTLNATEAEVRIILDQESLKNEVADGKSRPIPNHLHNISFDEWADIFCRYAVGNARMGRNGQTESTLDAALQSNVFYHDDNLTMRIQTSALACGIMLSNEQMVNNSARYFHRAKPYAEDTFKLFSLVFRLYSGPKASYNAGPTLKHVLRTVKAMDYALLTPEQRQRWDFSAIERAGFVGQNKSADGNTHHLEEMSCSLLATYGHILAAGASYPPALNYYLRAYSLRPEDPMLNLSIASAYIQHALKRHSDNRQYQIQQGISYLHRYYDIRTQAGTPALKQQEAEFNMGRMWNLLNLQNLAAICFGRCLELDARVKSEHETPGSATYGRVYENFTCQAAFALRNVMEITHNSKAARDITRKWLVV